MKFLLIALSCLALVCHATAGEIHEAAAAGDLTRVQRIITADAGAANSRDRGTTPLHEAARAGHLPVVQFLVEKGAALNVNDIHGATPLRLAIGYRRAAVADYLRSRGAVERLPAQSQQAAQLPPATRPPTQAPAAPATQPAPPQVAAPAVKPAPQRSADLPVARAAGSNAATATNLSNSKASSGMKAAPSEREMIPVMFPIHEAARIGEVEQIKFLFKTDPQLIESTDEKGYTPLHIAAANGQVAVAEALLGLRAKVNARTETGQTALHLAARAGTRRMVELLLANHAEVNVRDSYDVTPLLSATLPADREEFRAADLTSTRSPVSVAQRRAATAAMHQQQFELVKLLVSRRADVNARSRVGATALLQSVRLRNEPVVDLLLKAGADPNVADSNGKVTPLHIAAGRGLTNIAALLLSARAALDAPDARGETPLAYALNEGHLPMVKLLKSHGASIGKQQQLSQMEQALVAFYQQTETALQRGSAADKARILLELTPTKADAQQMFPRHGEAAGTVVELMRTEIKRHKPVAAPDQEKEIWRIRTEPPSLVAQDWRSRGWINRDIPIYSLVVDRVGSTSRPGDYCYVKGRWVLLPPLQTILAAQQQPEVPRTR